ncbi:MAG: hypothetical protein MUF00_01420 [Gemmatimonadaceae bacterium]|jgi:hypothetical protein|nr:hypothetical protein [Gemmatimonadaceae bacterium]
MRRLLALAPVPVAALLLTADQPLLKGEYKWALAVAGLDAELISFGAITPGENGSFQGKFTMEVPFIVESQVSGRQWGDSVEWNVTYTDKSSSCTGTMKGKGLVADTASKASGDLSVQDSCRGATDASFRLFR